MINLKTIYKKVLLYGLSGLVAFNLSGCLDERPLPSDELITIFNSDLQKTNKLKPLDTMYVQVAGLKPNAKHEIDILDSDKNLITTTQVYTDDDGMVQPTPVWYDVGLKKPDATHNKFYVDSTTQDGVVMKSFYIEVKDMYNNGNDTDFHQAFFYILKKNDTVEEVTNTKTQETVNITNYMRPKIYAASNRGEMENAFEEQNSKYMDGTLSDLTSVYLKVEGLPKKIFNSGTSSDADVTDIDIYVIPFDKDGNATTDLETNKIVKITKTRDQLLQGDANLVAMDINGTTKIWDINVTNPNNENNSYTIVLDIDRDGKYTQGVDISGDNIFDVFVDGVDGLHTAGFIVKNTPANDPLPFKLTDSDDNQIKSIPENPNGDGTNSKLYLSIENIAISDANSSVEAVVSYDDNGSEIFTKSLDIKTPRVDDPVRFLKYIDSEKIIETANDFTNDIDEPTKLRITIADINFTTTFTVYPVDSNTTTYESDTATDSTTVFDESNTKNGKTKIYIEFGKVNATIGSVYLYDGNTTIDENSTLTNSVIKQNDINVTQHNRELVFDLDSDSQKIINPTMNNGIFTIVVDYDNNGMYNEDNDTKLNITIRDTIANNLPNVGYINIASNGYFNFNNHTTDSNSTSSYGYIDEFAVDGSNTRGKSIRAIWNPYLKNKKRGGFYANYWSAGTGKESIYVDANAKVHQSPFNFGQQLDLYILDANQYPLKRGMLLKGKDVRGQEQTVTTQYSCSNGALMQSILSQTQMKVGKYYVILDINRDGYLTDGVDYVDAVTQKGKAISEDDPNVVGFSIVKELTNNNTSWLRQFGTSSYDHVYSVTATTNDIFAVGCTYNTFDANSNKIGGHDGYIVKYDKDGNQTLVQYVGTDKYDVLDSVTTYNNNLYVAGYTYGEFANNNRSGGYDAYIAQYTLDGNQTWVKQFGTTSGDYTRAISADNSGIYLTGYTYGEFADNNKSGSADVFITKYEINGTQDWIKQFGTTSSDYSKAIVADNSGHIYIVGYTYGEFETTNNGYGADIFIAKYETNGTQDWVKQFGTTSGDYAKAVAIDSTGNIYITGYTYGTFTNETKVGGYDGFLAKYSSDGTQVFVKQFGTTSSDIFTGITIDNNNNIYLAGYTYGQFGTDQRIGSYDIVVLKFDTNGNEAWAKQFGTTSGDYSVGITSNGTDVYMLGKTYGTVSGGTNYGGTDGILGKMKLTDN